MKHEYALFIDTRIQLYFDEGYNCAASMLKILGEIYSIDLNQQTLDAAIGMHGAGRYGAQCGLVEGALMFLGIHGKQRQHTKDQIISDCYNFADGFCKEFGSILCSQLRPEGFSPEQPPHLCEGLKRKCIRFAVDYVKTLEQ